MLPELEDYDWKKVFHYADGSKASPQNVVFNPSVPTNPATREDVVEIIAMADGEPDGAEWLGMFKLTDGRYLFVAAGCDFTGWG